MLTTWSNAGVGGSPFVVRIDLDNELDCFEVCGREGERECDHDTLGFN